MFELAGTTGVVTGGTSGIGLATARSLIAQKVDLVINSRQAGAAVEELAQLANSHGVRCVHVAGDMREPSTSARIFETAMATFGRIDGLVHCAGGPAGGTALELTPQQWTDAFDVHVHSAFHLFRAAQPALKIRGGSMILLSSAAALRGCPGTVAYQVVKASLIQMARALSRDHAAENIRVNCVAPGIIRTPFQSAMTETARQNNLANRIPLGREGQPEDVAAMIVQLMQNDFITGETVVLDGGMSMRMV